MINFNICTRHALFSAFALLTRIPLPTYTYTPSCVWAYPLVGAVLGLCYTAVFGISVQIGFAPPVAVVLVIISMVFLTGALHFDGLTDTADGIWGGRDIPHRQQIMTDSHMGTYGGCALITAFLLYVTTLDTLGESIAPFIAICAISRMGMGVLQLTTNYAKSSGTLATTGNLDTGQKRDNMYVLGIVGAVLSILFVGVFDSLYLILCSLGIVYALRNLFIQKIGGITGDSLGATQVVLDIGLLIVYSVFL